MDKIAPRANIYGYAQVNANGTFAMGSANLSMIKGSTGNYILQPEDHRPSTEWLAHAINSTGIPFICSIVYGIGPTSDGIQVTVYNTETQAVADEPFQFILWHVGNTIPSLSEL